MNRLTARTEKGLAYLVNVKPDEQAVDSPYKNTLQCILDCFERLAYYEDLEEQGRLLVLPCKVGDTVYKTAYDCARGCRYNPFNENGYSTACICLKCDTYPCDLHRAVIPVKAENEDWIWKNRAAFGKTVFLTREAAEAALKGGTP